MILQRSYRMPCSFMLGCISHYEECRNNMICYLNNLLVLLRMSVYTTSVCTINTQSLFLRTTSTNLKTTSQERYLKHMLKLVKSAVLLNYVINTWQNCPLIHPASPVDKHPVTESGSWYTKQCFGVNNLKKILPSISAVSMCSTNYTNHSLRATSVNRMFAASVPEKLIAETSGHRSLKALRSYERTNPNMQMAIDVVIANSKQQFAVPQSETVPDETSTTEKQLQVDRASTSEKQPVPVCTRKKPPDHTFSGVMNNCTINISYK